MAGFAKNRKILVTGASGFIGKNVLSALIKQKDVFTKIYCLSHRQCTSFDTDVSWVKCDLFDSKQVERFFAEIRPDYLIHLAWEVTPLKFWNAKENIDWLCHSIKLFDIFLKYGGKVFIGAGSIAEYDLTKSTLRTSLPKTLYGNCKFCLRRSIFSLRDACKSQMRIIWPQIGWLFGEDEPKEKFFSQIFYRLMSSQDIVLKSKDLKLPYIHVKHLGEAIAKCIFCLKDAVFPLCALKSETLENIIGKIARYLHKPYRITYELKDFIKSYKFNLNTIPDNIMECLNHDINVDIINFLEIKRGKNERYV